MRYEKVSDPMANILTPRCPLCCGLPMLVLGGGTQVFCGNDDCTLLTWNPSLSVDDNLMDSKVIHLPPMTDGKKPPDSE